jgi:hypothetical protein
MDINVPQIKFRPSGDKLFDCQVTATLLAGNEALSRTF